MNNIPIGHVEAVNTMTFEAMKSLVDFVGKYQPGHALPSPLPFRCLDGNHRLAYYNKINDRSILFKGGLTRPDNDTEGVAGKKQKTSGADQDFKHFGCASWYVFLDWKVARAKFVRNESQNNSEACFTSAPDA